MLIHVPMQHCRDDIIIGNALQIDVVKQKQKKSAMDKRTAKAGMLLLKHLKFIVH
jgi:hypothetical protein